MDLLRLASLSRPEPVDLGQSRPDREFLAAIFVFILRIAALHYGWHAPQPKRGSAPPDDDPSVTGVTGVTGVTSVGADTDSRDNA